jgi:hypothetical protein
MHASHSPLAALKQQPCRGLLGGGVRLALPASMQLSQTVLASITEDRHRGS